MSLTLKSITQPARSNCRINFGTVCSSFPALRMAACSLSVSAIHKYFSSLGLTCIGYVLYHSSLRTSVRSEIRVGKNTHFGLKWGQVSQSVPHTRSRIFHKYLSSPTETTDRNITNSTIFGLFYSQGDTNTAASTATHMDAGPQICKWDTAFFRAFDSVAFPFSLSRHFFHLNFLPYGLKNFQQF